MPCEAQELGVESADPARRQEPRCAVPPLLDGPYKPRRKPRDWGAIGMYSAVTAAILFALAVICPVIPLR